MIPERSEGPQETAPDHPAGDEEWFMSWQQAQQRVMRYLNALRIDPVRGVEIAHQALRLAMADDRTWRAPALSPVAASMSALRRVLAENHQAPAPQHIETARLCRHMPVSMYFFIRHIAPDPDICPIETAGHSGQMWPIMPAFKRGSMKSENVCGTPLKYVWSLLCRGVGNRLRRPNKYARKTRHEP